MEMDGPTRSIVDFVRRSDFSSLSESCVHGIVRNLVDAVGCSAAGFNEQRCRPAAAVAAFGLPDDVADVLGQPLHA